MRHSDSAKTREITTLMSDKKTVTCFTERELEVREDAKSAHDVPSESSSEGHIYEPLHVGSATTE